MMLRRFEKCEKYKSNSDFVEGSNPQVSELSKKE
jgi:hypothetical protein